MSIIKEMINGIIKQKQITRETSHSNKINQFLHLISSCIFIYCYTIFLNNYRMAAYLSMISFLIRQSGHFFFEPSCQEKDILGFDTVSKIKICIVYFSLPILLRIFHDQFYDTQFYDIQVVDLWIFVTFVIVFGRVLMLWKRHGFIVSQHWFIKFITDPFTDIPTYWRSSYQIF